MGKLGNTLAMLKILESGRKYTVNELASKIEVSPRMIKIYKAELEKAGIYIETISGIYGGYVYNHKNNYEVTFSLNDVSCLEKIIPLLDKKHQDDVEQLLEKIKTIVIYSEEIEIDEQDSQELKTKYNIASKAIKNNADLVIEYKGKKRTVTPHNITFYKDSIYLTVFSKIDNDLRTYNFNEIRVK